MADNGKTSKQTNKIALSIFYANFIASLKVVQQEALLEKSFSIKVLTGHFRPRPTNVENGMVLLVTINSL